MKDKGSPTILVLVTLLILCPRTCLGQQDSPPNALDVICAEMRVVIGKLAKFITHEPTQEQQQVVIERLDALIALLEKECESCRGGMVNANPSRPAADSTIRQGPGGMGDLHAAEKEGRSWAELPPHERDRIMQSLSEGFPAHYQQILERYYRRLATEEPVEQSPAEDDEDSNL